MWDVKNFLPPMREGEDEETMVVVHEKHLQHQIQLSIEKQDKLVVKRLLGLTCLKCKRQITQSYRLHKVFYNPGIIPYIVLRTTGK